MGEARPLTKQRDASFVSGLLADERAANAGLLVRVARLEDELAGERLARLAADRNAARFHALMLQARIRLVACEKGRGNP